MANEFEIVGNVTKVGPVEPFGTKGFRKRAIVILTRPHDQWPEHVQVELQGDAVDRAPSPGKITVKGWITGRMAADGRVWNTLKVKDWQQDQAAPKADAPKSCAADDGDDIPF